MKYKIGDVARLLGITPEAVRHYEDQGIIAPTKSKSSGYRYYGVWDIHILVRARAYRQFGYSLAETAELINHCNVPNIVSTLSAKETDIEKEITWNLNLLKRIRQMQNIITDADTMIGKYRIEYRPAMYRVSGQNSYELHTDPHNRELYHTWINKVPFVFPSALFQKRMVEKGGKKFSFGLGIDAEYADLLNVRQSDDVAYYPTRLCIYTTLQTNSHMILTPQNLTPAIDYLHSQGMKLSGDVVSRVVLMNKTGDDYFSWHQLWLPIE